MLGVGLGAGPEYRHCSLLCTQRLCKLNSYTMFITRTLLKRLDNKIVTGVWRRQDFSFASAESYGAPLVVLNSVLNIYKKVFSTL